jgi:hypothetical protein
MAQVVECLFSKCKALGTTKHLKYMFIYMCIFVYLIYKYIMYYMLIHNLLYNKYKL